jgi:hypothetical protein
VVLRIFIAVVGIVVVLALLLGYLLGPGREAESSPSGEAVDMTNRSPGIPLIDANRPAVTETAAFALG